MAKKKIETVSKKETKYTKDIIVTSKQYKKYQDLLTVVLDDSKTYTLEEVQNILTTALNSKIK